MINFDVFSMTAELQRYLVKLACFCFEVGMFSAIWSTLSIEKNLTLDMRTSCGPSHT